MNILFIAPRPEPYDSRTVRELPSGGTEKCNIFLGEAFQKLGHEVQWLTTPEQVHSYSGNPDVVITQVAELLESFPAARKVWWGHHFSDQPVIQLNAAFGRCFADRVVTLSRCQSEDFKTNLRMDSITIGHGVWRDELCTAPSAPPKDPYRLIYASTPFRGLERIPDLFARIKEREPRATIAICSSMATYGEAEKDQQYAPIFERLSQMEGVDLLGALNQEQLYREYARASIFFYPCVWRETYCLAMDEGIAHGCVPVVTDVGAIPERAFYVKGCDRVFTDVALDRMNNPYSREIARHKHTPQDWLDIAKQWESEVLE